MRESEQKFHFTMCNPPFYKPGEKAPEEAVGKPKEVEVAGGEVAFAKKMVDESRALLDKVTQGCIFFPKIEFFIKCNFRLLSFL